MARYGGGKKAEKTFNPGGVDDTGRAIGIGNLPRERWVSYGSSADHARKRVDRAPTE